MDSLIAAGAQALAKGDALGALNYVALRDDPPALALRGIAMAQLGDLARARLLLKQAARDFGVREAVARARCVTAEAEIALVCRDLGWPSKALGIAYQTLRRHEDHINAAHARYLEARYLLLVGKLDEAERLVSTLDPTPLSLPSRAALELVKSGLAIRRLRIRSAREALARAGAIARQVGIASLTSEVESTSLLLDGPAARLIANGEVTSIALADVERLLASDVIVIDACRHAIVHDRHMISLKTRSVLFSLARTLAEGSPSDASRATLLSKAFGAKFVDELHRARLRVEIGRLRKLVRDFATVEATSDGFRLRSRHGHALVVLAPLSDEANAQVLALLSDGESWSSSALALALGTSQRTVQRALDELLAAGKAQAVGKARARRWMAPPIPGFPTSLLLPFGFPNV